MRVVLAGASGQLGAYLLKSLRKQGHEVVAWVGRNPVPPALSASIPVDLLDLSSVERELGTADPAIVVHLAAVSSAAAVLADPVRARAINVRATEAIAAWCAARSRRMVYTSTDLVFDGQQAWNREETPAAPLLEYGRTKLAPEPAVLAVPGGLVARLSLLYGPSRSGRESFFDRAVAALRRGEPQSFFSDEFRTPLDYATAASAIAGLVNSNVAGLIHVGGHERMSRHTLMTRVAEALGLDPSIVRPNQQADVPSPEPRPADVSLDTTRLAAALPDLDRSSVEDAVRRMARGTDLA